MCIIVCNFVNKNIAPYRGVWVFCRLEIWPVFGWGFGPIFSVDLGIDKEGVDGDLAIIKL